MISMECDSKGYLLLSAVEAVCMLMVACVNDKREDIPD